MGWQIWCKRWLLRQSPTSAAIRGQSGKLLVEKGQNGDDDDNEDDDDDGDGDGYGGDDVKSWESVQ